MDERNFVCECGKCNDEQTLVSDEVWEAVNAFRELLQKDSCSEIFIVNPGHMQGRDIIVNGSGWILVKD